MPRSISAREAADVALTIEERVEALESGMKKTKNHLKTHSLYITQLHNTATAIRMNVELRVYEIFNKIAHVETLIKQFFSSLRSIGGSGLPITQPQTQAPVATCPVWDEDLCSKLAPAAAPAPAACSF